MSLRTAGRQHPVVPAAAVADGGAPAFAHAEQLGRSREALQRGAAWVLAIGAHGLLAYLAVLGDHREHQREPAVVRSIPVMIQRVAPPPPVAVAPPRSPPPRSRSRAGPPPAAAQAAQVVSAPPAPATPVDLQDFVMPAGSGESYAGGFTAAAGTSRSAVSQPGAQARGVQGGSGDGSASLARVAAPARRDWSCAWPDEEQSSDLRDARVTLSVHVDRDGHAGDVDVSQSPSAAFTEAARQCARGELYRSARDPDGRSLDGATPSFIVHFVR